MKKKTKNINYIIFCLIFILIIFIIYKLFNKKIENFKIEDHKDIVQQLIKTILSIWLYEQ